MCVLLNGLIHKISILSIYVLKKTSNKIIYVVYVTYQCKYQEYIMII